MSRNLLKSLIDAAEKAANIARKCREDEELLKLLIQEKSVEEANSRFVQDFKTLADVLIQETIIYDVGNVFPELKDSIKGEETPKFTNQLGESIIVKIFDKMEETSALLEGVLEGSSSAANLLAKEVHKSVDYSAKYECLPNLPEDFDYSTVGIWIDPIDATSQYIEGETVFSNFPGITSKGLDCVTVLIGVYEKKSGIPIIGVINQPFYQKLSDNSYTSKLFWGISVGDIIQHNINVKNLRANKIALLSQSETGDYIDIFKNLNYEIVFSSGAGHKTLKIITGEADIYILSLGTTYKWDTCGPQAILRSLGGDLYDFHSSLKAKELIPLDYKEETGQRNNGGLIAVTILKIAENFIQSMSNT